MSEEELSAHFYSSAERVSETSGGYGVRNICDRLRIAYGEPYGLLCESTPGKGTTIIISIPAIEPDDTP